MREAANMLRQMFIALINEGFTETQALKIVAAILAAQNPGGGNAP
jgi:hypothetical protein